MSAGKNRNKVHTRRSTILDIGDRSNNASLALDRFVAERIKQADGKTTNAYGEIEFGRGTLNTAKYIKVSHETKVKIVFELMTKHWNLKTPNLIISVTGGAKNFMLRTRLKEVFRRSLIKASESTGAWITTGGTRTGVMKHVGKAVEQYAAVQDDGNRVVTIGVAAWGVIYERDLLENHNKPFKNPKRYDPEEGKEGKLALLDHNHSHFILVDNKVDGEKAYATEIPLRTKLERFISERRTADGVGVMTVCVIVQGGPGSLKTVEGSITNDTPVVIVEGSGGWADVLAKLYGMKKKDLSKEELNDLINDDEKMEKPKDDAQLGDWLNLVKKCLSNSDKLLTVFSLDPTDLSRDLDIAILEALLKTNAKSLEQLKLAIAWNRSDIAKSYILNEEVSFTKGEFATLFFELLEKNKHKFCKVFLDYGVDLREYFTVGVLKSLYGRKNAPKHLLRTAAYKGNEKLSLHSVGKLLMRYLGKSYHNIYEYTEGEYCAFVKPEDHKEHEDREEPEDTWKLDDPYREIFQWAILFNYREIAKHVWEYMSGSTQSAIMASRMLKVSASKMEQDQKKKLTMEADANEYERLATGIFANCFLQNPSKSSNLLVGRSPKWGGYTCLRVAIKAADEHFVSSAGVQNFLNSIWTKGLSRNHPLHLILAGLSLFPIFTTVNFEETDASNCVIENKNAIQDTNDKKLQSVERNHNDDGSCTPDDRTSFEKLRIFYNAPVVKFWMNVTSFLLYLFLFAYIIMSAFQLSQVWVSVWEYLLLLWTSTFLLEEFREMRNQESVFSSEKFRQHVSQPWNVMDILSLTLFYLGFGLRCNVAYLYEALILYAIAFMIQCIRLVHIFDVHPVLGPKIIMVGKMLKDLWFFLFILVVFLLAYGVASQALLYPGETNFYEILVGIIYRPYWQIYGELFLDEINYDPELSEGFECDKDGNNANLPRCPVPSQIVPIISAVYLLFANVLLLNLLIAMFSYTFEIVQKHNKEVWMFQRYKLIGDYYFRPPFPPPLIIISHIHLTFSYLRRKLNESKKRYGPFRCTLPLGEWKMLWQWEHWHANTFIREKRQKDEDKVDSQLGSLSQRIDSISTTVEELEDRSKKLKHFISEKFEKIESLLSRNGNQSKTTPKTSE